MAEKDWEYYASKVPADKQIPRDLFMQLPVGRDHAAQRDFWYDENLRNQHEVFNCGNFPTPPTWQLPQFSYTSNCYDYPRK